MSTPDIASLGRQLGEDLTNSCLDHLLSLDGLSSLITGLRHWKITIQSTSWAAETCVSPSLEPIYLEGVGSEISGMCKELMKAKEELNDSLPELSPIIKHHIPAIATFLIRLNPTPSFWLAHWRLVQATLR